jgi:hypothetical protein
MRSDVGFNLWLVGVAAVERYCWVAAIAAAAVGRFSIVVEKELGLGAAKFPR